VGRERVPLLRLVAALALVAGGCAGAPARCRELPLAAAAVAQEQEASSRVDFALQRPCAHAPGLEVWSVVVDALPAAQAGGAPELRATYLVAGRGGGAGGGSLALSRTRAELPFRAIPQGSRHLRVAGLAASAEGFVGPSGSGGDYAYLRWRHAGLTSELSASLGGRVTLRELEQVAAALLGAPE
jgi:hypothetical protein